MTTPKICLLPCLLLWFLALPIPVERHAPDFLMELYDGTALRLSDLRGVPVVLNFWRPSCAACVMEMPEIQASWERHTDVLTVVGVQTIELDAAPEGERMARDMDLTYLLGADTGDIADTYGVEYVPSTFFIDASGRILREWTGSMPAPERESAIQDLLRARSHLPEQLQPGQ